MTALRRTLRAPSSLGLIAGLFVLFMALYTVFDLREGMRQSSLLTTRLTTPAHYAKYFGAGYAYGSIALNVALALLSAVLIAVTVANYRARRNVAGATCSASATVILGFATFGCPGCLMPLAGTLGITFFANSLPFLGLEFKLLALLIVGATLAWMLRASAAIPAQPAGAVARG